MSAAGNPTPLSSCMYSAIWTQKDAWIVREEQADCRPAQISAPPETDVRPLREKNGKKGRGCKHVPHRDKPAQVVAKRNARERRRVQAVNTAFMRLRKAVPIENSRGKRISKVKTLQNAIDYIRGLLELLNQNRNYQTLQYHYYTNRNGDFFNQFDVGGDF